MASKKLMLGIGAPVLVVAALLGAAVVIYIMMGTGGSAGSWRDFRDAKPLIDASKRIVVAKYLDEQDVEIPYVVDDGGEIRGSVTEKYRRFRIVESLKGDGKADDIMFVVSSVGYKTAQPDGGSKAYTYDVISLNQDADYVLFLEGKSLPEGYPTKFGDMLWTRPGEPGIAQADKDGRLTFLATDRYKDTIESEGMTKVEGSDAPFEMTKEDITSSSGSGDASDPSK